MGYTRHCAAVDVALVALMYLCRFALRWLRLRSLLLAAFAP